MDLSVKRFLDNPKAKKFLKIYSLISVSIFLFFGLVFGIALAGSEKEVEMWTKNIPSLSAEYPVSTKCGGGFYVTKQIILEANTPFVPELDKVCIGQSVEGRSIYAYYFGSGSNTVLYVGGVHGNEASSARIIDNWVDYLEDHPEVIPSGTRAIVVKIANPDGYAVKTRFNASRVDLNRNWDTASWQEGAYAGDYYYTYGGGPAPFSEPEVRVLKHLIDDAGVDLVIDYHCCAGGVWGGVTYGESVGLAKLLREKTGYPNGAEGWTKYKITGSFTTWAVEKRGITSATVEVWAGDSFYKNLPALKAALTF